MARKPQVTHDYADYFRRLSQAIVFYRRDRGLTQEQLAEMAGISRRYMGAIEAPNMRTSISLELLFNIAYALDVEPYQLLMPPYAEQK